MGVTVGRAKESSEKTLNCLGIPKLTSLLKFQFFLARSSEGEPRASYTQEKGYREREEGRWATAIEFDC